MKLYRAFATVGGLTMVSRVFGFVRDILIAAVLGTGAVADAFFLRRCCDRADREANDPEQVIDALLFEAPRHQGGAVDFAHCLLLVTE